MPIIEAAKSIAKAGAVPEAGYNIRSARREHQLLLVNQINSPDFSQNKSSTPNASFIPVETVGQIDSKDSVKREKGISYAALIANIHGSPANEGFAQQRRVQQKQQEVAQSAWYTLAKVEGEFIFKVITRRLIKSQLNALKPIFANFMKNHGDYIEASAKIRKDGVFLEVGSYTEEALMDLIITCEVSLGTLSNVPSPNSNHIMGFHA